MIIYRVSRLCYDGSHDGYEYYSNKQVANVKQREWNKHGSAIDNPSREEREVETIEFTLSKKGVIDVLNKVGAHPDNG